MLCQQHASTPARKGIHCTVAPWRHPARAPARHASRSGSLLLVAATCTDGPRGAPDRWDRAAPGGDAFEAAWLSLSDKFERDGLYTTSAWWIASRFALVAVFLLAAVAGSRAYAYAELSPSAATACFVLGAVGLAGFWQQSGFLMHDFMHSHVFHNRVLDHRFGWFFGCCGFGVCSKWWRDEHHEHHIFTNTVLPGVGCTDPQFEPPEFWAQNAVFFDVHKCPPWALRHVLRIQHLLFLPVAIGLGPIGIKIDALVGESRASEYAGVLLHFLFVGWMLSVFDTWREAATFYAVGSVCVGVLSLQLLISHMSQPVSHKDEAKVEGNWARRQAGAVIDVLSPGWLDWFHGGLNLHSVHHLFPRMCRQHYRLAHPQLVALCRTHGVDLQVMGWAECVANSVRHFRRVGQEALAAGFGSLRAAE
jgi:delta8-fatty-acid desaturase